MRFIQLLKLMASQGPFNTVSFLKDWQAALRMYFLYSGIESGLFKALNAPRTRDELFGMLSAKRTELLDALLEVGQTYGELALSSGRYRLRGRRAKALSKDKDEIFTGVVQATVTYYHVVFHDAAKRMRGGPLADLLDTHSEVIARFSRSTEPFVMDFLRQRLAGRGALSLLEIGCGSGVHLKSAAEINDKIGGVGIDMDANVVAQVKSNLAAWGLGGRFTIVKGDVREPSTDLGGPFDIITLFNNIYYFNEEERVPLFERLRRKLTDTGELLLITMVSGKGKDPMAATLNLATVSERGTTALPESESIVEQLLQAGFARVTAHRIMPKGAFMGFVATCE